jgi:hypothetical protein
MNIAPTHVVSAAIMSSSLLSIPRKRAFFSINNLNMPAQCALHKGGHRLLDNAGNVWLPYAHRERLERPFALSNELLLYRPLKRMPVLPTPALCFRRQKRLFCASCVSVEA